MSDTTVKLPTIRIRGRSFMALIVVPEPPFEAWLAALDQQMARSAGFFIDRPVVVNLAAVAATDDDPATVLAALEARDLRIIGVEGVEMALLRGTPWFGATLAAPGREGRPDKFIEVPESTPESVPDSVPDSAPEAVPSASGPAAGGVAERRPSLLINRPVRSGQSVVFEEGDVTVIGPVSSGAEIIAGGSIHVYGTLRGRAVAGLLGGAEARIFCSKLAAELLAIDGLYRTADHWGEGLQGKPVQVWLEDKELRLAALE